MSLTSRCCFSLALLLQPPDTDSGDETLLRLPFDCYLCQAPVAAIENAMNGAIGHIELDGRLLHCVNIKFCLHNSWFAHASIIQN